MSRFGLVCSTILGSILLSATSCSPVVPDNDEQLGATRESIVNGTPDTTHAAVVAVLGRASECSGTVVQVMNGNGYVLTAAHCCTAKDQPVVVVFSNDYKIMTKDNTFDVIESSITQDPNWNPDANTHDFCMFQFGGATAKTPVIPVMQTDDLATGSTVEFVGYGLTGDPTNESSLNSLRRHKSGPIEGVSALLIQYNQAETGAEAMNGGPCEGDSGGPALTTSGSLAVVGVTSAGDPMCAQYGVSGRVSGAFTDFIQPYLTSAPIPVVKDCATCMSDETKSGGACYDALSACEADASCGALLACYRGCNAKTCYQDCATKNVAGLTKYAAISTCVCRAGCATECASDPQCMGPRCGAGSADATCESCVETECCSEAWECSVDAHCADCLSGSTDPACISNQPAIAVTQCLTDKCATPCISDTPGGPASTSSSGTSSGSGSGGGSPSATTGSGSAGDGTASATASATGGNVTGGDVTTGSAMTTGSGGEGGSPTTTGSGARATGSASSGKPSGTSGGGGPFGAGGDEANANPKNDEGSGCSIGGGRSESGAGAGLLLGIGAVLRKRRRPRA